MSDEISDEKTPTGDYPIGYRKPPAQNRFKKGQSGNPTGRPKGRPNFATAFEEALNEPVVVNEGGQRKTVGKIVAIIKQVVNKAMQGDTRATQQVFKELAVIESDQKEATPPTLTLTDTDALVMAHLAARIRALTPIPGETDHDQHQDPAPQL
jgi:Family of unknown function (DUF5681)